MPQEHQHTIFHEMMSHPALFTHPHPKKVVIIDEEDNILHEVSKHDYLTEIVHLNLNDKEDWIKKTAPHSVDIIIHAAPADEKTLKNFFTLLHDDGILIQQSDSPFEMSSVTSLADQLRLAGFKDQHILHFPQPGFFSGWRSILMATKKTGFKRIREQAVFTKAFKTYYYNLDTHKAAQVLPEFMRKEWVI